MTQMKNYATKKTGKTEVDPLWNMSDIKAVVEWFENNNEWDGYLITLLELLLGRRIGDTVSMKWSDLYYENGNQKMEIDTIREQKTNKTARLPISSMVFEAVNNYLSHTKINPIEKYNEFIFEYGSKTDWINRKGWEVYEHNDIDLWCERLGKDFSDKRKDDILESFQKQKEYSSLGKYLYYVVEWNDVLKWESDDYRKKLNKSVETAGITSRVSTHTLRKTFGHWIYKMHMFDPSCLLTLQDMFEHATVQQTVTYIGLGEEKKRQYLNEHGDFIRNVLAGKGDEIARNMPVISLRTDDLIMIFRTLTDDIDQYQAAINMANKLRIV